MISVDWSKLAGPSPFYLICAENVGPVGSRVADFVRGTLMDPAVGVRSLSGFRPVVGFSLGAHVVGRLGTALQGRMDRVTGLDPAGARFFFKTKLRVVLYN